MSHTIYLKELKNIAKENDIEIIYVNIDNPDFIATAFQKDGYKVIIINVNNNSGVSNDYILAHELGHFLNGSEFEQTIYTYKSNFGKIKEEKYAHEWAINFFAERYFYDIERDERITIGIFTINNFIKYFGIDNLKTDVKQILMNY